MIYQRKEFVLKNGTKLILKSPEQSDAKMLLNQIVKTTSQTDYLLSTPNDFDEDISKEEEFISRFNESNDYLICAYVDGIIVGNSDDTTNDTIKNRQNDIISLIKKAPPITRKEIAQILNISEPTVARDLKLLQEIGVIKRNGSNKTGYWEILENGK